MPLCHRLLYVLPDVAYITELLPTKKDHSFAIQNFRQINGNFITDNDLIPENIGKLVKKLEHDEYHLVLPDFLFTDTILEVLETTDSKVKSYLSETLLPHLEISEHTHQIITHPLTEYGGKTRVQLAALEKVVTAAFLKPLSTQGIKLVSIVPLSWSIKSVVSLEPSITIAQLGSRLYLSQHYIGIDQTIDQSLDDVEALSETIKTLKGAEPSIQTVYLLTNQVVEQKLTEALKATLPIQQLTFTEEENSDIPQHVKQIIESGLRTLSITDFPVPKFKLVEPPKDAEALMVLADDTEGTDLDEQISAGEPLQTQTVFSEDLDDDVDEEVDLPSPTPPPAAEESEHKDETDAPETEDIITTKIDDEQAEDEVDEYSTKEDTTADTEPEPEEIETDAPAKTVPEHSQPELARDPVAVLAAENSTSKVTNQQKVAIPFSGGELLQTLFRFVAGAALAIGLGAGLTLAAITWYEQRQPELVGQQVAIVSPEPTPTPEPSPTPAPEPKIDLSKISVLVVNSTSQAGYAGRISDRLVEGGVGETVAANARGDYEAGNFYVLLPQENTALVEELSTASGLDLEYDASIDVTIEDGQGRYDAVIVLATQE